MIGIYKITNKINGQSYIGLSVDIEERWYKHKKNYKNLEVFLKKLLTLTL